MKQAIILLNTLKIDLTDHTNNKIYTRLDDKCISVLQHLGFGMDYFEEEEYEDEAGVYIDLIPAAMQFFIVWDWDRNKFSLLIDLIERINKDL